MSRWGAGKETRQAFHQPVWVLATTVLQALIFGRAPLAQWLEGPLPVVLSRDVGRGAEPVPQQHLDWGLRFSLGALWCSRGGVNVCWGGSQMHTLHLCTLCSQRDLLSPQAFLGLSVVCLSQGWAPSGFLGSSCNASHADCLLTEAQVSNFTSCCSRGFLLTDSQEVVSHCLRRSCAWESGSGCGHVGTNREHCLVRVFRPLFFPVALK